MLWLRSTGLIEIFNLAGGESHADCDHGDRGGVTALSKVDVESILKGDCADVFSVLGMHKSPDGGEGDLVVRAFLPRAKSVAVVEWGGDGSARYPAKSLHEGGLFEATIDDRGGEFFAYELKVEDVEGGVEVGRDPYSFCPVVGGDDQYLFNEGTHSSAYDFLGAHPMELGGATGVHFAVWAPNAARVSLVGNFDDWDGRRHVMRSLGESGVWEIFIPHLTPGAVYKYEVKTQQGEVTLKSDPFGFQFELPPRTASIVCESGRYEWSDGDWLTDRASRNWVEEPMAIYEVHLGSWRQRPDDEGGGGQRSLSYREMASELVDYAVEQGFTHLELMPIAEYPYGASWGYQVTGYFAPTSRFGSPDDFAYFVDCCHNKGIGVIVDWVPAHFPRDDHALARFDGTALFEHADPRQGAHPDWGTLIFNYGRSEVRSFLLSNAAFWFERFHVDGIRVDAVASMLYLDYSRQPGEWIPNPQGGRENLPAIELLKQMNTLVYGRFPGAMTVAEESTAWPAVSRPTFAGGLGFGFKWNMGWMNDVLRYMAREPVHRKYHHSDLTFGMLYAYQENFVLPLSHDEVVYGKRSLLDKMPGDAWQKFANLRLLLAFMYAHPGKKLLFMGGEFGQRSEWDHNKSLDWDLLEHDPHRGVQLLTRDLNRLYRGHAALHRSDADPSGFEWIDCQDVEHNVISFLRRSATEEELVFVYNFSPLPQEDYKVGFASSGTYEELLNTDAAVYGGTDVGNAGLVTTVEDPWHGRRHSSQLRLPPLAALVLKRQA